MPVMLATLQKRWKKAVILLAVGVALAVVLRILLHAPAATLLTDLCFAVGSTYLCAGLCGLIKNLGMFNSFRYGLKHLRRIFRNQQQRPDEMKEGYLEYCKSRSKTRDVPWLMTLAAVFLALSLLLAIPQL